MYETQVTVVGNILNDPDRRELNNGAVLTKFRLGSTERRYDRTTGGWVDGDRFYVDVNCWRHLADNAAASLVKGDPVVVVGRLFTRNYEHEGQRRYSVTLDAHSVAADLSRCTAVVTRTRRGAPVEAADNVDTQSSPEAEAQPESGHEGGPRLVAAAAAGEG